MRNKHRTGHTNRLRLYSSVYPDLPSLCSQIITPLDRHDLTFATALCTSMRTYHLCRNTILGGTGCPAPSANDPELLYRAVLRVNSACCASRSILAPRKTSPSESRSPGCSSGDPPQRTAIELPSLPTTSKWFENFRPGSYLASARSDVCHRYPSVPGGLS